MAATVSWDGLRELAAFRAENGCAISVYVDLDPSVAPTAGDAASRVNSLIHEGEIQAESAQELTHGQRESLRNDLGRIRDFFTRDFDSASLEYSPTDLKLEPFNCSPEGVTGSIRK